MSAMTETTPAPSGPPPHQVRPSLPVPVDKPSWKVRRRTVLATLVFCASMTVYLAVWAESDDLRSTIANGILFLAGSVLMGYIFGVVWNDKNFMSTATKAEPDYDPYYRGTPPYTGEG